MKIGNSLEIQSVCKFYGKYQALENVRLKAEPGEFVTILGSSGSGKTTLLKIIAGFEKANGGKILIAGENIEDKKAYERNIGMLFQNYALFPHLTIRENIAYPLKVRKYKKAEIEKKVDEALKMVHLEQLGGRYPKQLSGGQQQRVALARAIVYEPPLLLLDEPLGALDKNLRQQMQLEIKKIQKKVGITTISVTHDQEEALTMSDKICIMNKGKLEQIDTPENIYKKPKTKFVAEFLGTINLLEGKIIKQEQKGKINEITIDGGKIFEHPILIKADNRERRGVEKVLIAIRPESLLVSKNKDELNNNFKVKVTEVIYLGESFKVKGITDTNKEVIIKISPSKEEFAVCGEELYLGFNSEDVSLVYESERGVLL